MSNLPLLSQLLDNVWFRHFIAECLKERERCRTAVCEFPITNISQLIATVEARGEANAYNNVVKLLYEKYDEIVNLVKEGQAVEDTRGVTNE